MKTFLLAVCLLAACDCAKAAVTNYAVTIKGTSSTLAGQKFKFTATGTMTWDNVSGSNIFTVSTSAGLVFDGVGTMGNGKKAFAAVQFGTGGTNGCAVFSGKFDKTMSKFNGKFYASVPNRLGPAPSGFVFTTGSMKATLQ